MDKTFCIYETYKIEHPQHNYIGKSWADKISSSGYKGSGKHLKHAFKKYGKKAFEIKIIFETFSEEEAYAAEERFIKEMDPYYNIYPGGMGAWSGEGNPKFGKGHLMRGENHPCFGMKRPDMIERNKENAHHTLEKIKEIIIQTGSFTQAGKLLNYKAGHVGLSKRLRNEGLQPIYDGSPYSKYSKIIGFEKITKQHKDLLVPKINPTRRPTNIEIEELKKCIIKHGYVTLAAKELVCGSSTAYRMLKKNNLKSVYNNTSTQKQWMGRKIIGFEDLL